MTRQKTHSNFICIDVIIGPFVNNIKLFTLCFQIQGEGQVRVPLVAATNASPQISVLANNTAAVTHKYRGLVGTIATISKEEGYRALFNGLSAGLQRQMCFASIRLGLYDSVKLFYSSFLKESPDGLQLCSRIFSGLTTGAMAVALAQPTDVVKIRFQAQQKIIISPDGVRSKLYKSTFATYRQIGVQEGLPGLWRGAMPNIGRNAVVNVAEIVCYDIVKDSLLKYTTFEDNIKCHFTAAFIAGFCTTVVASPIDVVKTRYMNASRGKYSGVMDCTARLVRNEGFTAFYKGFVPSFARIVSWNIALWLTYEQMKKLVFKPKVQT
jgi:solute carrier family 25 (mitochondrial uncoupling protein), member 8/9